MGEINYAVRTLRRSPVFAATTVVTLAVTIGAATAVFSVADAVLLRPPPYPEPGRLAMVQAEYQSPRGAGAQLAHDAVTWEAVRDGVTSLDSAVYFGGVTGVNLVVDERASFVNQQRVSAGYFRVLDVPPAMGREFAGSEDVPGGPALAIISHDLWMREFDGDGDIIGRRITLRGEAYHVIGVTPAGSFTADAVDVWTPLRASRTGEGRGTNFQIVSRLRPGATWAQANGELAGLGAEPLRVRGMREENGVSAWLSTRPLHDVLAEGSRDSILMLGSAVMVVLLMACVNIATLLLARGAGRSREMATRLALGSGRIALARQSITESMLLASAGGVLGFAVAGAGVTVLEHLAPTMFPTLQSVAIDARTLAVMAGLVLATGVVLGLVPALQAARVDVRPALVDGGSRSVAGSSRHWLRRGLVMAEVALGAALLVLTVLLLRTVVNVNQMSPGFEPQNLVTASVSLQDARYQTAEAVNRLFDESLRELGAMPDVESAGISLQVPYTRLLNWGLRLMDDPDLGNAIVNVSYVTPGFIETLRIPMLQGRPILARDQADAPPVVLVNETFARLYGQDGKPTVGRLVALSGYDVPREIVGIIGDVQQADSGFEFEGRVDGPVMATPTVLIPAAQIPASFFNAVHTWFRPIWTIRPRTERGAAGAIERAVARTDPLLPVSPDSSVEAVIAQATSVERLLTRLVGSLAVAAVLLAALGIYGLIAQSVVERRREIAIRLALGATPGRTAAGTVLAGAALAATGTIGGLVISIWGVRLVRGFLWGVDEYDPLTYIAVMAFFVLVATMASLLPSIRVLRLDPADTLRG